jgi:1-deoxy-D-xylulose-5-phosphate reductoisomerase
MPAALNAANEEAVQAFLDERISLTDIPRVIEEVMDSHETKAVENLEVVVEADSLARHEAGAIIERTARATNLSAGR